MTIFNLGSINADHFYRVPHLPAPGETLAATRYSTGLGGKGANQSVAAVRAGASVVHIGAIGPDGEWATRVLSDYGVDVSHVGRVETATAHAIINVDEAGENAIVIFPGANHEQSLTLVKQCLDGAGEKDLLLLQNETNMQAEAARVGKAKGMFVIYSAAPFDADAVRDVMDHIDLLVMNEVEAEQLTQALGVTREEIPVPHLLITSGAEGAMWRDQQRGRELKVPAFPVKPVDTTGAGDCFIGTVAAGITEGLCAEAAMRLAAAASALQVQRPGTAQAIPTRAEVDAFLAAQVTETG
jgi:ribokinase